MCGNLLFGCAASFTKADVVASAVQCTTYSITWRPFSCTEETNSLKKMTLLRHYAECGGIFIWHTSRKLQHLFQPSEQMDTFWWCWLLKQRGHLLFFQSFWWICCCTLATFISQQVGPVFLMSPIKRQMHSALMSCWAVVRSITLNGTKLLYKQTGQEVGEWLIWNSLNWLDSWAENLVLIGTGIWPCFLGLVGCFFLSPSHCLFLCFVQEC